MNPTISTTVTLTNYLDQLITNKQNDAVDRDEFPRDPEVEFLTALSIALNTEHDANKKFLLLKDINIGSCVGVMCAGAINSTCNLARELGGEATGLLVKAVHQTMKVWLYG